MIDAQCEACHAKLSDSAFRQYPAMEVRSPGPWAGHYFARQATCPGCGGRVFHIIDVNRPASEVCFTRSKQLGFVESKDFEVAFKIKRGAQPTGRKPLHVAWLYHPFAKDFEWSQRVRDKLLTQDVWVRSNSRIGVLPESLAAHVEVFSDHQDLFDQILVLDDAHVRPVVGPYPSARAEMSIGLHFGQLNLQGLYAYWPSAVLPQNYIPLMSDLDLAKQWAVYSRKNLPVKATKRK